jgi:hypothetical protein
MKISNKASIVFAITVMNETVSLVKTIKIIEKDFTNTQFTIVLITSKKATPESKKIMDSLILKSKNIVVYIQSVDGGSGIALREFRKTVGADFIFMLAADGETPANYCIAMFDKMNESGADIIQASRWLTHGSMSEYPVIKRHLNKLFQVFLNKLFRKNISDWTFGMRLYRNKPYTEGVWNEIGHAIYLESLIVPLLKNFTIEEYPVDWQKRSDGNSNILRIKLFRYLVVALKLRIGKK